MTTFKTPTLSRRAFVGGATAGLLTPGFAAYAQLPTNPDVVVIGAGAAGLAATRELIDRGLEVVMTRNN